MINNPLSPTAPFDREDEIRRELNEIHTIVGNYSIFSLIPMFDPYNFQLAQSHNILR